MPPRKKAKDPAVVDRSFWICRTCSEEVMFQDGLWREAEVSRRQGNWFCRSKLEEAGRSPLIVPGDLVLRPGFTNYYHDAQEIDPAADLQRIISEL